MMKGIGGPLLCIGDLLSDVGEDSEEASPLLSRSSSSLSSSASTTLTPDFDPRSLDLTQLFQENYEQLDKALAGTDHSWTGLTLKLCSALETANKLVRSTNSNAISLSERVAELERIVKRADSAVDDAKSAQIYLSRKAGPLVSDQSAQNSKSSH